MKPANRMSKKDLLAHLVTHHRSMHRVIAHIKRDKLVAFHDGRHAPDAKPGARPMIPHTHGKDAT